MPIGLRADRPSKSTNQMSERPLAERSILIVEDDIILSTDLAFLLTEAGCKAVLPVMSNTAALSAMAQYGVEAAILDVNVQDEWVFPVANALEEAEIPFLFLTAYSLASIPVEHRRRPFLQKPHHPEELINALSQIIERRTAPALASGTTTAPVTQTQLQGQQQQEQPPEEPDEN